MNNTYRCARIQDLLSDYTAWWAATASNGSSMKLKRRRFITIYLLISSQFYVRDWSAILRFRINHYKRKLKGRWNMLSKRQRHFNFSTLRIGATRYIETQAITFRKQQIQEQKWCVIGQARTKFESPTKRARWLATKRSRKGRSVFALAYLQVLRGAALCQRLSGLVRLL